MKALASGISNNSGAMLMVSSMMSAGGSLHGLGQLNTGVSLNEGKWGHGNEHKGEAKMRFRMNFLAMTSLRRGLRTRRRTATSSSASWLRSIRYAS